MGGSTSSISFDVLVVGGGPAGSAAAYTAARAGLRTCLVDKRTFPRDKLCGGLLTERSRRLFLDIFERSWPTSLVLSSDEVSFFSGGAFLARLNGYSTLHFTMRKDFDAHLLSLASSIGAETILGRVVKSIARDRNSVCLSDGTNVQYKVLVGADGVNSTVARALFREPFDPKTIGFGLEVEVPRSCLPTQSNGVEIDFGAARWGYGWVFPKYKSFTIGVGGIHKLNPDLRECLSAYLAAKGLSIGAFSVKGQYIPFGDYRREPGLANILLAGDAAGVVDPITGEGIAYAMQTGRAAAMAAASAIRTERVAEALDLYRAEFHRATADIRQANLWRYLIFPAILRRPFAWAFADASTLQRGYLDILAGNHQYNALYGLFALQVRKAVKKLSRRGLSKIGLLRHKH